MEIGGGRGGAHSRIHVTSSPECSGGASVPGGWIGVVALVIVIVTVLFFEKRAMLVIVKD